MQTESDNVLAAIDLAFTRQDIDLTTTLLVDSRHFFNWLELDETYLRYLEQALQLPVEI